VTRCANYPRGGRHLNWINFPHFFTGPVEGQLMMNAEWNDRPFRNSSARERRAVVSPD